MLEYSFTALLAAVITGLVLVRFLGKRNSSHFPAVFFPKDKRENFRAIKKERFQKSLNIQKIYLTVDFEQEKGSISW